ncbi:MAG TPA: cupin domain-containing protein [Nitrososphaerales archaeon]|nr:cupin domain-containing protein [Nitrososphaerales archaeon]
MDKIQVVHPEQKGQEIKKGFKSRLVFESDADHVGEIRISGGTIGGWHHHGKRNMYEYVVSGKTNIEFGKDGQERAILSQGDFFLIPPGLAHRDVNPHQEEAFILIFNIGQGPTSCEVSGPDLTS